MRKRFFGQYLLSKGLITAPQLLAAVEYQDKHNSKLGELAVSLGLVTPFEAQQINAVQVREDCLFGAASIQLGLLTEEQVKDVLAAQRDQHVRLGQALETLGYLDRATIDSVLSEFLADAGRDPDVIEVPDAVREKDVGATLFDLGHKLLLRAWDLPNKPDKVRIEEMRLTLSDRNARVDFHGNGQHGVIMVGVPNDVAWKAAKKFAGDGEEPSETEANETVLDFAHLLGQNFCGAMAEHGRTFQLGHTSVLGARATLPPEVKVIVLPYLTHLGQVLIGFSL
jgi:hypothetical protein